MPVSFSYDFDTSSNLDSSDRSRISLAFQRFGWEHLGGSSWRYPPLGAESPQTADWFNHIIPALMYFRAIIEHSGIVMKSMSLDAHSSSGYRSGGENRAPVGQSIMPADAIELFVPDLAATTQSFLSEKRLRKFVQDAAASLNRGA